MELWVVREMGMMGGRCEKNRSNGYLKKKWKCMRVWRMAMYTCFLCMWVCKDLGLEALERV